MRPGTYRTKDGTARVERTATGLLIRHSDGRVETVRA